MGNMNIKLYQVVNMGDFRSVVKYGTLPNSEGPAGNGYSVLPKGRTRATAKFWLYSETVVAETRLKKRRYTWKISTTEDWKLQFFVSVDGSKFVKVVGNIMILHNNESFDLWTAGDSIVIGNDDQGLGRDPDGRSFRYFQVFTHGISYTNHPPV